MMLPEPGPTRTTATVDSQTAAEQRRARAVRAFLGVAVVASVASAAAVDRRVGASKDTAVVQEPPPVRVTTFVDRLDVSTFQRGSLHVHSARSDGDSPAQLVFAWYRDHGFQFIALTDHNNYFDGTRHPASRGTDFVVIPGEEITMAAAGQPVHVNALCTKRGIGGGGNFRSARAALGWATAETLAQGGIALVNHPNFHWALQPEDIAAAEGAQLLEIWSGHPHVRSDGDAAHLSVEAAWEQLLATGRPIAAVAVDDMHALTGKNKSAPQAYPGTGWIGVFAEERSREAICAALAAGRLYASSGPKLTRLAVSAEALTVWPEDPDVTVEFLDQGGTLLHAEAPAPEVEASGAAYRASYRLRGGEAYVRARITAPSGSRAWTQAYRTAR